MLLDCKVIPVGSKYIVSTVSENVRITRPVFISNEKSVKTGDVVSGMKLLTGSAFSRSTGITSLPFMSTTVMLLKEIKVFDSIVARSVSLLISFESSNPREIIITVLLSDEDTVAG